MDLTIISAGAGSGKTYTLTRQMAALLCDSEKPLRASGILATTFTTKAAAEIKERVRTYLLEQGMRRQADELENALINTVHSVGGQLLKRFAFEVGLSPNVDIIPDGDDQILFDRSLSIILSEEVHAQMASFSERLGFQKDSFNATDWQKVLKDLCDLARANGLDAEGLEKSKQYSIDSFFAMLPSARNVDNEWFENRLRDLLAQTILALDTNKDSSKGKHEYIGELQRVQQQLNIQKNLHWYEWAKLCKPKITKKSEEDVFDLVEFARTHTSHPQFHADIRDYISTLFDLSAKAIEQYARYKKERGLLDYTDMEALVLRLLDNPSVCEVLAEELDLLLVDEFQDTSPIQLAIFLRLTRLVKRAIWVGDPKQSIYGFRGADPKLMQAIVESLAEKLQILDTSWRSRQEIVDAVNGLFVPAFASELSAERVALKVPPQFAADLEPEGLDTAVQHYFIAPDDSGKAFKAADEARAHAAAVADFVRERPKVREKGTMNLRELRLSDVAVLCRSNANCRSIAQALRKQGIAASIAQNELMETQEVLLVMACLKFLLNEYDTLAVAEILRFAAEMPLTDIVHSRLEYLHQRSEAAAVLVENGNNSNEIDNSKNNPLARWGSEHPYIQTLNALRPLSRERSVLEIVHLLLEKLQLRRLLATWSEPSKRIANADKLRFYAQTYESNCLQLQSAATLGGFILWLQQQNRQQRDKQADDSLADAVQVLTYHAAKGLEWPAVFCTDLDEKIRDEMASLRLVDLSQSVDLHNPLADRLLCYWVNPYSNQNKNTELDQAMQAHPEREQLRRHLLSEEKRLLYVGLTRACDYLILPTMHQKATLWLNRVYNGGDEKTMTLLPDADILPYKWEGRMLPLRYRRLFCPREAEAQTQPATLPIFYVEGYSGEQEFSSQYVDTPAELLPPAEMLRLPSTLKPFHPPLSMPKGLKAAQEEEIDLDAIGLRLAQFALSYRANLSVEMLLRSAETFAQSLPAPAQKLYNADFFVQYAQRFYAALPPLQKQSHRLPFRYAPRAQAYASQLDGYIECSTGEVFCIAIAATQEEEAENYAAHLYLAAAALNQSKARLLVIYAREGRCVEVGVKLKV